LMAIVLFASMITDAMSVPHNLKVCVSAFCMYSFSFLYYFFEYYKKDEDYLKAYENSEIFIAHPLGGEPYPFNFMDRAADASKVLFFFSLKQMWSTIFASDKPATIRVTPVVEYQDLDANAYFYWNPLRPRRNKRLFVGMCAYFALVYIIALVYYNSMKTQILIGYNLFALIMVAIMVLIDSKKSLIAMNSIMVSIYILCSVGGWAFGLEVTHYMVPASILLVALGVTYATTVFDSQSQGTIETGVQLSKIDADKNMKKEYTLLGKEEQSQTVTADSRVQTLKIN